MAERARWLGQLRLASASLALAALAAALAWSSVWTIDRSQRGVVLRFGALERVVEPGIHFTWPWPVEVLRKVGVGSVESTSVGFKYADQAKKWPPTADEVQWLTGDTNIVELQAVVLFTIADPAVYLFGHGDLEAEALELGLDPSRSRFLVVRKCAEAVLTELVGGMTVDEVLSSGKTRLAGLALPRIQEGLDRHRLGLRASGINIVEVNPPVAVMSSFNDVASAKSDRERRLSEADGYARRLLPGARASANGAIQKAESERSALRARAAGAAESFRKLAAEAARDPELLRRRLWYETVERVLARTRNVVFAPQTDGRPFQIFVEP